MLTYWLKCNETCWIQIEREEWHELRRTYGDDVTLKVIFEGGK